MYPVDLPASFVQHLFNDGWRVNRKALCDRLLEMIIEQHEEAAYWRETGFAFQDACPGLARNKR